MSTGDTIGIMNDAFFVSKGVILEWLNELLDVSSVSYALIFHVPVLMYFIYEI